VLVLFLRIYWKWIAMAEDVFGPNNCPIRERTADGVSVGRCCFWLGDNKTCPRHGDVSKQVKEFKKTGSLQEEPT